MTEPASIRNPADGNSVPFTGSLIFVVIWTIFNRHVFPAVTHAGPLAIN